MLQACFSNSVQSLANDDIDTLSADGSSPVVRRLLVEHRLWGQWFPTSDKGVLKRIPAYLHIQSGISSRHLDVVVFGSVDHRPKTMYQTYHRLQKGASSIYEDIALFAKSQRADRVAKCHVPIPDYASMCAFSFTSLYPTGLPASPHVSTWVRVDSDIPVRKCHKNETKHCWFTSTDHSPHNRIDYDKDSHDMNQWSTSGSLISEVYIFNSHTTPELDVGKTPIVDIRQLGHMLPNLRVLHVDKSILFRLPPTDERMRCWSRLRSLQCVLYLDEKIDQHRHADMTRTFCNHAFASDTLNVKLGMYTSENNEWYITRTAKESTATIRGLTNTQQWASVGVLIESLAITHVQFDVMYKHLQQMDFVIGHSNVQQLVFPPNQIARKMDVFHRSCPTQCVFAHAHTLVGPWPWAWSCLHKLTSLVRVALPIGYLCVDVADAVTSSSPSEFWPLPVIRGVCKSIHHLMLVGPLIVHDLHVWVTRHFPHLVRLFVEDTCCSRRIIRTEFGHTESFNVFLVRPPPSSHPLSHDIADVFLASTEHIGTFSARITRATPDMEPGDSRGCRLCRLSLASST